MFKKKCQILTHQRYHEIYYICMTFKDYLGNPLRRILMLFRVINAITTSGRLMPKTITSTGIIIYI